MPWNPYKIPDLHSTLTISEKKRGNRVYFLGCKNLHDYLVLEVRGCPHISPSSCSHCSVLLIEPRSSFAGTLLCVLFFWHKAACALFATTGIIEQPPELFPHESSRKNRISWNCAKNPCQQGDLFSMPCACWNHK